LVFLKKTLHEKLARASILRSETRALLSMVAHRREHAIQSIYLSIKMEKLLAIASEFTYPVGKTGGENRTFESQISYDQASGAVVSTTAPAECTG